MQDPWDRVTAEFRDLGHGFKETYSRMSNGNGPSEDEIKDAFATLAGAWDQVAASVSEALKDPETREKLKRTASSLATALGNTLAGLGAELKNDEPDG